MATDYYSWDKLLIHATSETGKTAKFNVRLGPSHRRWLIVGHSDTINRDELFAYISKHCFAGEALVHMGKEPLVQTEKEEIPESRADKTPTYLFPFRVVEKANPGKFNRMNITIKVDGKIRLRSVEVKTPIPMGKQYPWLPLESQTEDASYYIGAHARYLLPGKSQTVTIETTQQLLELLEFMEKLTKTTPQDRSSAGPTVELIPLFPHDHPILKEVIERLKIREAGFAQETLIEPLVKAAGDKLGQLTNQTLSVRQTKFNPSSNQPEFTEAPRLVSVQGSQHQIQVDQLLRGVRLVHCVHKTNAANQFVQQVTTTDESLRKMIKAEEAWVSDAANQILHLLGNGGPAPIQILAYQGALSDIKEWLKLHGVPVPTKLEHATERDLRVAASTVVIKNTSDKHRIYYWPLLGAAMVGCDLASRTDEQIERELFMQQVLKMELPEAPPFTGYATTDLMTKLTNDLGVTK